MCGIAGRIMSASGRVGQDLVDLMDAQEHRGADSTGFAIYGPVRDDGYVLRGIGFDKAQLDADLADFANVLRDHGCQYKSDPEILTDWHQIRVEEAPPNLGFVSCLLFVVPSNEHPVVDAVAIDDRSVLGPGDKGIDLKIVSQRGEVSGEAAPVHLRIGPHHQKAAVSLRARL